jgi:hypothetical protein
VRDAISTTATAKCKRGAGTADEMAAYGTLVAWAQAMGHDEAASLLQQNLA